MKKKNGGKDKDFNDFLKEMLGDNSSKKSSTSIKSKDKDSPSFEVIQAGSFEEAMAKAAAFALINRILDDSTDKYGNIDEDAVDRKMEELIDILENAQENEIEEMSLDELMDEINKKERQRLLPVKKMPQKKVFDLGDLMPDKAKDNECSGDCDSCLGCDAEVSEEEFDEFLNKMLDTMNNIQSELEKAEKEAEEQKCDGDCANCPPHYGYRYGRWYYGHAHQHGCQRGGNGGALGKCYRD